MKKMVLGLMVVAGLLGTSTVVANAADTDSKSADSKSVVSTGDVAFSSGTLSLSVNNKNLSFGKNTISAADATLGASTTPTVKVNDLRGTNVGWSLTVAQGQQFNTKTDASGSALTNAALTVTSTKDSSDSTSSDSTVNTDNTPLTPGTTTSGTTTNGPVTKVASALPGHGNGISAFTFGGSTLAVPGATNKLEKSYTTTLTWTLGDTPSN
ncbi:WxL domain-containing protein [Lactiplantibacillus pentosus]|uniref:WxL domain-containing protein n=1 Tax=Lactiplantibacillus pentosus TaxID=1589 RepID=UPI0037707007